MIVVGVDGSTGSEAALRWAIDEAKLRHALELQDPGPYQEGAERFLADFLAGIETEGVEVAGRVVQGSPGQVLVEAAADAELLVVGSRGHGELAALLLGSVSHHVAQHATCPAVIVRS